MRVASLSISAVLATLVSCAPSDRTSPVLPPATPSTPTPVSVTFVGQPEMIFDREADRCGDDNLVNLPVRAIRTADGALTVYVSGSSTYRLVGKDFSSLKPNCGPVLPSDWDRNPANFNWAEWMGSPYTLDGQTVHAIIQEEYRGDQAGSSWQASEDFGASQTHTAWRYLGWDASGYRALSYDASKSRWRGARALCHIGAQSMHPDLGCDPTLAWISPVTGTVTVRGTVFDQDPDGGDGVTATILKGPKVLWSATIKNGDSTGKTYAVEVPVVENDVLYFRLNAHGSAQGDSTYFDPKIIPGSPLCPPGHQGLCTLISLTYAESTDGGANFSQPSVPDHLLATVPHQYHSDWLRAIWQPSNIVQNPNDGFYYALVRFDEQGSTASAQGMCAMRTQTLDDPASWRAWDGSGFNMRFIDPYVESSADPSEHYCALVSPGIGTLTSGLSYNSYLARFIALGVGADGFYISLSDDLVHWTPPQLIMKARQIFDSRPEPSYVLYPTLIDHDSPSASFDVSGQSPFLYYWRIDADRSRVEASLLRVRVEFRR